MGWNIKFYENSNNVGGPGTLISVNGSDFVEIEKLIEFKDSMEDNDNDSDVYLKFPYLNDNEFWNTYTRTLHGRRVINRKKVNGYTKADH